VRAGLGWCEIRGVPVKETSEGFIVALAEEIGFADGLIGQGAVESKGGRGQQKGCDEYREAGSEGQGHCE
jgi:hypothetical protein